MWGTYASVACRRPADGAEPHGAGTGCGVLLCYDRTFSLSDIAFPTLLTHALETLFRFYSSPHYLHRSFASDMVFLIFPIYVGPS